MLYYLIKGRERRLKFHLILDHGRPNVTAPITKHDAERQRGKKKREWPPNIVWSIVLFDFTLILSKGR